MQTSPLTSVLNTELESDVLRTFGVPEASEGPKKQDQYTTAAKKYRNEQLLNLTPVQVIDKLYRISINACRTNDTVLAKRAINELIVGLNFEHEEIAVGLFRLYEYCKYCIRKGKMNDAVVVLEELRATWAQAFNL
jgi:flagellin-specific chaperone FliS